MKTLLECLRSPAFSASPDGYAMCMEAADRIEALEKHKRLQMEDIMNLGAQLGRAQVRIEQLEAALRKIACKHVTEQPLWWQLEARAALDQSPPPVRQENDDVFKGFRGNNEA
jgi:uncharacterized coiled-coil protein SlyX